MLRRQKVRLRNWQFYEIRLEDKPLFEEFIKKTTWPTNLWSANFPFIWAYSKEPKKKILWKIVDNMLVTFSLTSNKKLLLLCLPFGSGHVKKLLRVLYKCLKFCSIWNGPNSKKTKVRMINSNQLDFLRTSPNFNQLFKLVKMKAIEKHYSIPLLGALEGKDFKSLRKKISRYYKKYPDVLIRQYRPTDYNKLLYFNKYWEATAGKNYSIILDKVYFKEIIRHYKELDQIVLIAEVNNRIVGLIAGGELPTGQSWICLGKADKTFTGLSELLHLKLVNEINKLNPKIELLNSGGDLASEGLKRFKEKFKPILNLERYKVFLK